MALRGRLGSARVVVLTITDDEFPPVQQIFQAGAQIMVGRPYFASAVSPSQEYGVIIRQIADRTNHPTANAVGKAIEHFRPEFLILAGTAGGVHGRENIALGDVVVANYVDYCEFRKLLPRRNLSRRVPFDQPSLYLRENFVDPLRRRNDWMNKIPGPPPPAPSLSPRWPSPMRVLTQALRASVGAGIPAPLTQGNVPKVLQANIVSGEKIWGDPTSIEQRRMLREYDKVAAIETEAVGLATEVFAQRSSVHYNPQYLVIRGISDMVNLKGNDPTRHQWSGYAAAAAAAFTFCLVQDILAAPAPL